MTGSDGRRYRMQRRVSYHGMEEDVTGNKVWYEVEVLHLLEDSDGELGTSGIGINLNDSVKEGLGGVRWEVRWVEERVAENMVAIGGDEVVN